MKIILKLHQVCIGKREIKCRRTPMNTANVPLHWSVKAQWKKAWQEEVGWAVLENRDKFGKLPLNKPRICVVVSSCKEMDIDGLYTSTKPIWDGLRLAGVIVDDNPKNVYMAVEQKKVKHREEENVNIIINY
jgi:hypothetical protein